MIFANDGYYDKVYYDRQDKVVADRADKLILGTPGCTTWQCRWAVRAPRSERPSARPSLREPCHRAATGELADER